jgi:hypothetical protein
VIKENSNQAIKCVVRFSLLLHGRNENPLPSKQEMLTESDPRSVLC